MSIAIIGTGNIGSALARDLADGGYPVTLAGRDLAATQTLAEEIGGSVTAADIPTAIRENEIVVPAVWLDVFKQLLAQYQTEFAGKIIVDPTNPVGPDGKGGYEKVIPADLSSSEVLRDLLPEGARIVKAFGTLPAQNLRSGAHNEPDRIVGFYAADDTVAGERIAEVIAAAGFDPIYVGGLHEAIRIEMFGDLHVFGGLGKPVTRPEAESALAAGR